MGSFSEQRLVIEPKMQYNPDFFSLRIFKANDNSNKTDFSDKGETLQSRFLEPPNNQSFFRYKKTAFHCIRTNPYLKGEM